ncbi:MAG: EthD family reductase, partial [Gemmatimonadota bacterium]
MPRLIALYNVPDDPDAFDAHYREVHTPIVERYPNLREVRLTRPRGVAGARRRTTSW